MTIAAAPRRRSPAAGAYAAFCASGATGRSGSSRPGMPRLGGTSTGQLLASFTQILSRVAKCLRLDPPDNSDATKAVFRDWLKANYGKPVGVKVDWKSVSPREIHSLSERMFDAASVPQDARSAYYSAFNRYIYGL